MLISVSIHLQHLNKKVTLSCKVISPKKGYSLYTFLTFPKLLDTDKNSVEYFFFLITVFVCQF